jgi:hypothetical protein
MGTRSAAVFGAVRLAVGKAAAGEPANTAQTMIEIDKICFMRLSFLQTGATTKVNDVA